MDELKLLSDDVYEQIKDFDHKKLTEEQESLIDKLILDEELNKNYRWHGLCDKCKQLKYDGYRCQICNNKFIQQSFKNWTSGNDDVDKLIQKAQLKAGSVSKIEWFEYDRFENIEYLAKGGFGTVFKAIWIDGPIKSHVVNSEKEIIRFVREGKTEVALKCLHNSQDFTPEFLREVEAHLKTNGSPGLIVHCYGITKDPETKEFMMVMAYAQNGSLRQYLSNNFNSLSWDNKLSNLYSIASGLETIHRKGLIHHDFHCGNILGDKLFGKYQPKITDLGLCKPANANTSQSGDKKIYGVLPYVAPEVLRGKVYTQESDIYGFGIIAYEVCTGLPPYHDISHDVFLANKICQGLRPKSNYKIPQLILDIIQQCWDADPSKRPNADKLFKLLNGIYVKANKDDYRYDEDATISKQIKEADEINKNLLSSTATSSSTDVLSYTTHPQAIYTSKLLDFKNLPEPKNLEPEYSESIRMDFAELNIDSKDEIN